MAIVTISIDRDDMPTHTDEEFEEWLRFQIGDRGGMNADNPLQLDMTAELKEWV
ncbi:MAG: hypothetical protein JKY93_12670 [Gammaproteobacteria bacterium]|nr:hypothetical protein [Gammaproteobacteria bacterium]